MASYHLSAKIGAKGKAASHASYIAREGKYTGKARYEDLEATEYGNMPAWAQHTPAHFWKAADVHERANGSAYREIEIALPRELTPSQRLELVRDFVAQELGEKHAYQFAIHAPKAAVEQGDQPHAHIMYSERIRDGIERDPEQYFKRYNTKNPENGGAKKFSGGKRADELKSELLATRERWADVQNEHLEKHGWTDRVTHLSLIDQGIERLPEKHLGSRMTVTEKTELLERRANEKVPHELSAKAQFELFKLKRKQETERELADKTAAENKQQEPPVSELSAKAQFELFKQKRRQQQEIEHNPKPKSKQQDQDLDR